MRPNQLPPGLPLPIRPPRRQPLRAPNPDPGLPAIRIAPAVIRRPLEQHQSSAGAKRGLAATVVEANKVENSHVESFH
jgi:hypothetical protein